MARLAISLLGIPSLIVTGRGEAAVPPSCWLIVAYLMTRPGRLASRSTLAGTLWPEQTEEAARHCLATALWRMKTALGGHPSPLVASVDQIGLRLERGIWVDSQAFERRVKPILDDAPQRLPSGALRRLRMAVRLYAADFLANQEEEWIAVERERLRCLYLDALYALGDGHAAAGDWPAAVATARRLCAAEPLREDAQRLLMTACAKAGNRALALKQYRRLVDLLEEELGVDPMPETTALARRLAGARAGAPSSAASAAPAAGPIIREALDASREAVGTALKILDGAIAATAVMES
jgi:DNA-binding SARP family transcriptional activator